MLNLRLCLRLVQLNLVSLGTNGNYKEGKEIFLATSNILIFKKSSFDNVHSCYTFRLAIL